MQNNIDPHLDLTGKLIIKVQLGEDIRRIPIHNEDITYDELVLMMQRVYRGKLGSNDDIIIKYKDEDGDLITIFDSSDLSFAIQCSRILKITLFVNNMPKPLESDEVKLIKRELQLIRDRVNRLLDRLEPPAAVTSSTDATILNDSQAEVSPFKKEITPRTNVASGKEFDPLSTQRSVDENSQSKVMSSFNISNEGTANTNTGIERSGTPDSLSSIGSSSSNLYRQQQQTPVHPASQTPTQPPQPTSQASQPQILQQQQQPPAQPYPQQAGSYNPNQSAQPQPQPGYQTQATYGQQQAQQTPYNQAGQGYNYSAGQQGYNPQQASTGQTPAQTSQPGQQTQTNYQQQPYGYGNQQPGQPGQSGQPGQPMQQQQQQQGYPPNYQQQGQKMPGYSQPAAPAAPPTQGAGNPYARGGQTAGGYGAGYPRPAGGYSQGYQ